MSNIENLKLPEPLNVNKNILNFLDNLEKKGDTILIFDGVLVIETIFQLYLIKKYKSKCVIYSENKSYKRPIGITVNLKMKFTKDEENEMKKHFTKLSKINLARALSPEISKSINASFHSAVSAGSVSMCSRFKYFLMSGAFIKIPL